MKYNGHLLCQPNVTFKLKIKGLKELSFFTLVIPSRLFLTLEGLKSFPLLYFDRKKVVAPNGTWAMEFWLGR